MKYFLSVLTGALVLSSCGAKKASMQESSIPNKPLLASQRDSVAYAFGVLNGEGFKASLESSEPNKGLSRSLILEGFSAQLRDTTALLSVEQARNLYMTYIGQERIRLEQETIARNKSALEENKAKPGVQVTASGLQYRIIKDAQGSKPKGDDTVVVHYAGRTIDGVEFDSSYKRGEPASFPLGQVIKGWTEGVGLMSPGAKYEFMIPSELAYGERGAGNAIAPHATLIFEVDLLEIKPAVQRETPSLTPKPAKKKAKAKRK